MGESRFVVEKPGGKTPLVRPIRIRVDNFKMGLRELSWGDVR
jgi:hypothetical protein